MIWKTGNRISRNLNPETVGEFHRPRCISNEFPPMRCWTLCFSFLVIVRQAEQSGRSLLVCKKNDSANYLCTRRTVLSAWRPRECRVSLLIIEVTLYVTLVNGIHFRDVASWERLKLMRLERRRSININFFNSVDVKRSWDGILFRDENAFFLGILSFKETVSHTCIMTSN